MKVYQVEVYDKVRIFEGIYLTVRKWEKPDPLIGLGENEKIYPPPLFSRIEGNRLVEVDDSAANLLSGSRGIIEANNFSLTESGEKLLILWSIGKFSSFSEYFSHLHKNVILSIGRYSTFSNGHLVTDSRYCHMEILAVLPADGGVVEAFGQFFDETTREKHHKMLLKTLRGEVKIEFPC